MKKVFCDKCGKEIKAGKGYMHIEATSRCAEGCASTYSYRTAHEEKDMCYPCYDNVFGDRK